MPNYQRPATPGATMFFTVVTNFRQPILTNELALKHFRTAFREEQAHHALDIDAVVILPDHLHCVWTLPPEDARYSMRWSAIKGRFTELFLADGGSETRRSTSRQKRGERGIWQRRFWDHMIRNDEEYGHHMDYIHYNPVKHGLVSCPHSSFAEWTRKEAYAVDWLCVCAGRKIKTPNFGTVERNAGE